MDLRFGLAVIAGKLTAATVRRTGRGGGTTLPGRVSVAIDGNVLPKLSRHLVEGTVLVSGTNGKTTTASLLRTLLEARYQRVAGNRAGANLVSGIAAALVAESRGANGARVAVFEVDEASLPAVSDALLPRIVVVTNLFRDQLDRYGELESSATAIGAALAALPASSTAILCADDPRVASLGESLRARVLFYGLNDPSAGREELPYAADARFCPRCGEPFAFDRVYAGHLGSYRCPRGDFARPELDLAAARVQFSGLDGQRLAARGLGLDDTDLTVPLSGIYNSYNVLAAVGAARVWGLDVADISAALRSFTPAFGRLEEVELDGRRLRLMLAKNPASFNEVLHASIELGDARHFLIGVNDRYADGTDISWIWDVDFELLGKAESIVLSGTRALDMAIRLKYAGIDGDRVRVAEEPGPAIDTATRTSPPGAEVFVLPTYTAMLELRRELTRRGHLRPYWDLR